MPPMIGMMRRCPALPIPISIGLRLLNVTVAGLMAAGYLFCMLRVGLLGLIGVMENEVGA